MDCEPLLNPAEFEVNPSGTASDELSVRKRRGYPVMLGHAWSNEVVDVLVDQYFPFIDRGYELDSLVNHFIGGQGFDFDHPAIVRKVREDQTR